MTNPIRLKELILQAEEHLKENEIKRQVILQKLKDDFNCDSVEDAEQLLARWSGELKDKKKELRTKEEEFEHKWGEILDRLEKDLE